jgi:Protein of unknown function (DUF2865)
MTRLLCGLGAAALGLLALGVSASAQGYSPQGYPPAARPPQAYPGPNSPAPPPYPAQGAPNQPQASNPVCVRLESQLATMDSSANDPARVAQIKQREDAIAKQQADLDRIQVQAHKVGCASEGFLSLFSGLSPQCGPLTSQIQQMRGNLDRLMGELEQLRSGGTDQQAQRQALIGQLAQNNCGPQYAAAARASGPQGFIEALLGGGAVHDVNGDGAPAGTYHTVCVRTCDGFYFPVSYSTVPSRFPDDEHTCQRMCPAAEATLYSFRNPGEQMEQAVSASGQQYTALPNAFRYRKELVASCSCRRPGESWADALRNTDDASTLESSDIVVTDKNAKTLSQVPGAKPPPNANTAAKPGPGPTDTPVTDPTKRNVRVVGPPFVSGQ